MLKATVRLFDPIDGDVIDYKWASGSGKHLLKCPPYAFENVYTLAEDLRRFVGEIMNVYIEEITRTSSPLFKETLRRATEHATRTNRVLMPSHILAED